MIISTEKIIAYFTGVRACSFTEDFIIRPSETVKGFIHVAGIQSPGLTAAPAIANMVLSLLRNEGLRLTPKPHFQSKRQKNVVFHELPIEKQQELIEKNPQFGHVICRCEQVTEAEIIQAIHAPIPALTIDAIKRRTRAGMGRCQGGSCLAEVARILSREAGIPLEEIRKNNEGSCLFVGKTKQLLGGTLNEH